MCDNDLENEEIYDEVQDIMDDFDLDYDEASEVFDIQNELGIDSDDALELWEIGV